MNARQTFKTLWKYNKWEAIRFFFPLHIYKGQLFIMLPHWYNGHFSMTSINKMKE
jgi:hypothetical protein